MWRQLWRVLERSHLVVQIVDARNPLRFRCKDLEDYVRDVEGNEGEAGSGPGKRENMLLINKADLLTANQRFVLPPFTFFKGTNNPTVDDTGRITSISKASDMHSTPRHSEYQYKKHAGRLPKLGGRNLKTKVTPTMKAIGIHRMKIDTRLSCSPQTTSTKIYPILEQRFFQFPS